MSTETTYDPLDIVLVLDVSGSMGDNNITSYKYTETTKEEWSCDDIYNSSVYYYYMDGEGYYRRVSWDDEGGIFRPYRCWITAGGTRIGNKVYNWNDVSYRGKLYTRTNEGTVTRMQALKTAVNKFIDNVATQKDSKGKAIENHISIVKFAGEMQQTPNQYKVGNDMYKSGKYTYNYSQIVTDMTDVSTGSAALKAAVNGLKAGGATSADYGMQLASHVLSQHKDNPVRRSVVIMFTDGEPNHSSDFDKDVAKDAIAAAKGLKDKNTVVFTIGIFNGAYPNASVTSNNTSDTNKYMHAVSSNYPGAAYIKTEDFWSTSWDWSFGERAKDSNYYLAASNAADLEDIFVEISNEVNTLAVKVDATSVLSDTLSGAFDFNAPENAEYSGITVAKYPVTGMENGVYTWGAAQELAIGEGEGKVQVEVAGKKLEVTGFDYGANAVTTKTEGETTTYSGYKLVVTIPIKPDTEYHGWADGANYYDTNSTANGSKAGLEYGETGSRQKLELNDSPEAPVTGYTVSYAYKTGTKPDNADALLPSSSVHIEGQEYNLETTPSADGWTFTGWLDSSDKEVTGKQTMGTVPVTYYGKWEQKQPGVSVEKTAKRTRGNESPVTLPNNTNDPNEIGRVQVGDVINYTVTIKNTGKVTFGNNINDYRFTDTFSNAAGDLIQIDEDGKQIGKVESGKRPPNIGLGGMEPGDIKTLYYRYEVLSGDVGNQINNSATAEIKSGTGAGKITKSSNVRVLVEKPEPKTATLSFKFVNGTNDDELPAGVTVKCPEDKTVEKNKPVTLETVFDAVEDNNSTWSFVGWYTDADCTEAAAAPYVMPNTDTTLYGKWTKEEQPPKTATLRFEFKSGTDGKDLPASDMPPVPNDVTEEVGTAVQLTNYTETVNDEGNKGKWTFGGWFEGESLTQAIAGDSYQIPEGGKTLYGKWTFEADEPADTKLTIAYYLMHADGTYPSEATDRATTDGKVGEDFTAEPMKTAYDDKGYVFDEDAEGNRIRGDLVLNPDGNVFKLYYKAVPGLEVTKTIKDVTRDGERLDPTDPEVEVKEGDVIEYEITVRNSGKLNLTDVVLTDEFTGAEGDLTFISGDDYTVDGYEITLKNDLNVGDSVTIKATYEVQLGDSGYEIRNKAIGAAKDALGGNVTGESRLVRITPDALKAFRIFGSVYKYVKSEKGTFNKDGETVPFEFKVTSDKKGEEILDTFTIDVDETVKAGETSEGDWGGFDFNLSEEEFENLDKKEFNGKEYPVVYLWELKGDLKNMSYSTKRITLYLDRPNISYYSAREPMVEYLGTWMAYADPDKGADADIINIYGKQSSSGGTVKVGPQLNRDDHVAYIMGYPDGTVQPKGEITRAEACTIFFRPLTDSSRDYYFSKTNDYTDVNAGDWFNNAISTLSNAGIVTGYNDGTFRPNQPITRGEMAKIIANFANLNKGTKSFTDLSGHWSKTYVELAAGNGWIAGYPDGSFRPDQKITRAETVTMINRVLERVPAKELRLLSRSIMLTFPDNNPGDWYYIAIQEASNSHEYQRSVYETMGDEMWTKLIDNVDWTKLEK